MSLDMVKPIDIAFHIGAHKTATTHLQRFLTRQRAALRQAGCIYFGPSQTRNKGTPLMSALGLTNATARKGADIPTHLRSLTRGKRLLLSEENLIGSLLTKAGLMSHPMLYPDAPDRLARWADAFAPHRLHLYFAVRSPAGFLLSAYSQSLMAGTVWSWDEFLKDVTLDQVDWIGLVTAITEQVPAASITVWRYEDYAALAPEILKRMTATDLPFKPVAANRIHSGLSAAAVEASLTWHSEGHTGRLGAVARQDYPITETTPAFAPWSADDLAKSQALYNDQVAKIDALDKVTLLRP